jgi:hypothetical protein
LFGGVTGCPEHAHPSRLGDFDDNIPAMGEGEQWEFDTEHIANG